MLPPHPQPPHHVGVDAGTSAYATKLEAPHVHIAALPLTTGTSHHVYASAASTVPSTLHHTFPPIFLVNHTTPYPEP